MSSNPFFSICIPAYNCGEIIIEALGSIASQSYTNWEIVIVDDGSTDNTSDICLSQHIVPSDKYTYIRADHGGLLLTRMRLLERAQGEVIISLDADDLILDKDALKSIHELFAGQSCELVLFNATRDLSSMKPFVDYSGLSINIDTGLVDLDSLREGFSCSYNYNNVAFKAYKRSLIDVDLGVPVIQMTEDRYQSAFILDRCRTAALLDKPIYFYRPNAGSITESKFDIKNARDQIFVEKLVDRFSSHWGIEDDVRALLWTQIVYANICTIYDSVNPSERHCLLNDLRTLFINDYDIRLNGGSRPKSVKETSAHLLLSGHYDCLDLIFNIRRLIKSKTIAR